MTPMTPTELNALADRLVRSNWRDIPVVDLTDAEVALMSPADLRHCHDLLHARHMNAATPSAETEAVESPVELDIDAAEFAIIADGRRIKVYPGEGASPDSFAGELINPTLQEVIGQGHISCLWDRSKVVLVEGNSSLRARAASLLTEEGA
jgi:hypothetical protein